MLPSTPATSLPAARRRPRRPVRAAARAVHAWWALALVQGVTRLTGFRRLQQLLAAVPVRGGLVAERRRAVIAETRVAVSRARRAHVGPVACLQRSAACVYLLRRRGVPATLVVGVRAAPGFEAHAWAEVDGQVVNDDPAVTAGYTVITRG